MLTEYQTKVLKYIVDNNEEYIVDSARNNGINKPDASVGVAKFLSADSGNFAKMSTSQKHHYDNAIKPLIIDVPCDGMINEDGSCIGNGSIDEDSLLGAYIGQDMRCQHCVSTKDAWFANNP
ncbi:MULTISPECIES: hypothetical protein [Psychrobacter]|uniref:hypothetical protein n=1 Tax=Psychrobacter TaxID=497 RepID=UPI00191A2670|nr:MULTISPECIES: hypothetical protein [Psychrobacter]MCH1782892.1 hypothetical protein [Psychrobacter glaciei]